MTGSNTSVGALAVELAENRNPYSISGFHREVGRGSHSEAAESEVNQSGVHWARVVSGLGNELLAALELSTPLSYPFVQGSLWVVKSKKRDAQNFPKRTYPN